MIPAYVTPAFVLLQISFLIRVVVWWLWVLRTVVIVDFPVTEYGGTKTLVLSTRTVIGGQNNFLGIAYIVVAGLCILLGAIFTARHLIKPRYPPPHPPRSCVPVPLRLVYVY